MRNKDWQSSNVNLHIASLLLSWVLLCKQNSPHTERQQIRIQLNNTKTVDETHVILYGCPDNSPSSIVTIQNWPWTD
jgi:hypothetical protein